MFTILVFSGDTSNFNLSSIHAVTASFVLTASSFVLQKILKSSAYRIENYLLDQTWYKPRDIIRLFSIIQKQHGQKSFFDQEIFDSVRKTYAEESWIEFEEVLTAKYSDAEVEGIKKSLTSLALPFEIKDFQNNIDSNRDFFEEVETLAKNRKTPHILKDL